MINRASRPDLNAIRAAHERIQPYVHRTPVVTCLGLDRWLGMRLFFKCENLQKAGAFKSRGACNAVFSLDEEQAPRGVVTHSSGNHAGALARAAQLRGIPAYIVMPTTAPQVKVAAVREYGGQITFCEPTLVAREATARTVMQQTGAALIHPYDDEWIIAGQATVAVEFLEQVPELELVIAPVGGGGLLAGILLAVKALRPDVRVVAAEPQNADDAYRSWKSGSLVPAGPPGTIADGLLTSLGEKTLPIILELVDDIWLASEAAISRAMRRILERTKQVVEPSAAVPLAALVEHPDRQRWSERSVGLVLSGGNVDLDRISQLVLGGDSP